MYAARPLAPFVAARDVLLKLRTDYTAAVSTFQWPVQEYFNWALDYFDVVATRREATALHIVEEDGRETVRSFENLSRASNRVANLLRSLGAQRGDCLLLMLGNEVALWETLLAAIKLGLVVTPATPLLTVADLQDRIDRGRVRHVVTGSEHVSKFASLTGDFTRIAVGDAVPGWHPYDAQRDADAAFTAFDPTRASDPMLLYFTSGTTAAPKLVVHTHESYPSGTSPRCTGSACSQGMFTGTSARRDGLSTRGARSSHPGTPKPRSSSSTPHASTPPPYSKHSCATRSRACARRRPSGAC